MNQKLSTSIKKVVIHPGETYATDRELFISTLLGSCVAACLFDPVQRILGMNHFLLSSHIYKQNGHGFTTPSGRYGVHAMELLINQMLKLGAQRQNLKAKAFGGATLQGFHNDPQSPSVGEANVKFICEFLENEKIPLLASDMGGTQGRTIYFDSRDYSVYVKKHKAVRLSRLVEQERSYKEGIKQQEAMNNKNINLWN